MYPWAGSKITGTEHQSLSALQIRSPFKIFLKLNKIVGSGDCGDEVFTWMTRGTDDRREDDRLWLVKVFKLNIRH